MIDRQLSTLVDACVQDIREGRRTLAECLADYPQYRADLESLVPIALAMRHSQAPLDPQRRLAARS
jgi:hypothetical protein